MFKRNEGLLDRIVRVALGMTLLPIGLYLLGGLQGSVVGLVIVGLGVLGLFTGLTGYCPLYIPFGINTLKKEKELIDRFKSSTTGLMEKCISMMAGSNDVQADSGSPIAEQICGQCPPSIGRSPNQQG